MPRPSRVRRVGKWVGVAVSLCLLVLWGWSVRYSWPVSYTFADDTSLNLKAGTIEFAQFVGPAVELACFQGKQRPGWSTSLSLSGGDLDLRRLGFVLPGIVRLPIKSKDCPNVRLKVWIFPIWIMVVVVFIPTALIWYRDWRHGAAGHCRRCGYDLTKNESGICPECGFRFPEQSTVKASTVKSEVGEESEVKPLEG